MICTKFAMKNFKVDVSVIMTSKTCLGLGRMPGSVGHCGVNESKTN